MNDFKFIAIERYLLHLRIKKNWTQNILLK